jgi:hypothetical protein
MAEFLPYPCNLDSGKLFATISLLYKGAEGADHSIKIAAPKKTNQNTRLGYTVMSYRRRFKCEITPAKGK